MWLILLFCNYSLQQVQVFGEMIFHLPNSFTRKCFCPENPDPWNTRSSFHDTPEASWHPNRFLVFCSPGQWSTRLPGRFFGCFLGQKGGWIPSSLRVNYRRLPSLNWYLASTTRHMYVVELRDYDMDWTSEMHDVRKTHDGDHILWPYLGGWRVCVCRNLLQKLDFLRWIRSKCWYTPQDPWPRESFRRFHDAT